VLLGVAGVFSAGYLACVALQVVFRYVLQLPLVWSEELALYLFIWSSLIAAATLVGTDEHFSISYFADLLPARLRRILDVGITILCIAFALLVLAKGTEWSWRMRWASSVVLKIPQGAAYAVIPLTALYMLLHLVDRLGRILREQPSEG
jgi:TRAP-type C4-dicarboxylate transport system permease small subunit